MTIAASVFETLRTSESDSGSAMNRLNANSSVADITEAGYVFGKFQMIVTALSQAIKSDAETKQTAAQTLGR